MASRKYKRRNLAKWYEKMMAKRRGGHHRGGPGEPDYVRGREQGEIKYWKRPLNKYDVKVEIQKGRTEIVSREGFTRSAVEYVRRYYKGRVRLYHRGRRIV